MLDTTIPRVYMHTSESMYSPSIYMWHCMEHPALWVYRCCIIYIIYGHFRQFLGRCTLDVAHLKHVILFVDVMSFNDAVIHDVTVLHVCWSHDHLL